MVAQHRRKAKTLTDPKADEGTQKLKVDSVTNNWLDNGMTQTSSNQTRNAELAMLDLIVLREFRNGRSFEERVARKAELIKAFDLLSNDEAYENNEDDNLTHVALELDRALMGSAHYRGHAYFWNHEDRDIYRPMSRQDRIVAHHARYGITR